MKKTMRLALLVASLMALLDGSAHAACVDLGQELPMVRAYGYLTQSYGSVGTDDEFMFARTSKMIEVGVQFGGSGSPVHQFNGLRTEIDGRSVDLGLAVIVTPDQSFCHSMVTVLSSFDGVVSGRFAGELALIKPEQIKLSDGMDVTLMKVSPFPLAP